MRTIAALFLILTSANLSGFAQVNIITTIAGTGVAGYSGDGGPAINANLNNPHSICLDNHKNLFVCDAFSHAIRKIDIITNVITTVAGTGVGGYNGDNILATNAQLFIPQGICVDSDDNLYVSDGLNQRIRKISSITGVINTIAGNGTTGYTGDNGLAIDATMNGPVGIFIYKNTLLFCDYNNHVIRKVNLVTGNIDRVAGTGNVGYSGDNGLSINAEFNGGINVICDTNGNIFISDQFNGAIRKINSASGIITTIAGNGILGYSGDSGPATVAQINEPSGLFLNIANNDLFVADYRNGAIRKVDGATGIITTVAGGAAGYGGDGGPATAAKLKCTDVCVDDNGAIYIADYVNNRVRRVSNALKIDGLTKVDELSLYPNPTSGRFSIQVPATGARITINDIAGHTIYQQVSTSKEADIDITNHPPGTYMVYVQCGEDRYMSKVVVQ